MLPRKYFSIVILYYTLAVLIISCDKAVEPRPPENKSIPIFINEFIASNKNTTIVDEFNQHADWIELYNASDSVITLRSCYLTDSLNFFNRWRVPDTLISAKGFLLFWADSEMWQGRLHTNFRLNKGGEQIGVFSEQEGIVTVLDSITYTSQKTDTSFGRFPDGGPQWKIFSSPTPGQPNQ